MNALIILGALVFLALAAAIFLIRRKFSPDTAAVNQSRPRMQLPKSLKHEFEPDGTLLMFSPEAGDKVFLRLSTLTATPSAGSPTMEEQLRSRPLDERESREVIAGRTVIKSSEATSEGDLKLLALRWEVGLVNHIVAISASVIEGHDKDPEVVAVLEEVPELIKSFKLTDPAPASSDPSVTYAMNNDESVTEFGPKEQAWLQRSLNTARSVAEAYGETGEIDAEALDRIFAQWIRRPDNDRENPALIIDALGAALGQICVNTQGMRWVVIEDNYGRAYAPFRDENRFRNYPQDIVRKRVETGETGFFVAIIKMNRAFFEQVKSPAASDSRDDTS